MLSPASCVLGKNNKHYFSKDLKVELDTGFQGKTSFPQEYFLSCHKLFPTQRDKSTTIAIIIPIYDA